MARHPALRLAAHHVAPLTYHGARPFDDDTGPITTARHRPVQHYRREVQPLLAPRRRFAQTTTPAKHLLRREPVPSSHLADRRANAVAPRHDPRLRRR